MTRSAAADSFDPLAPTAYQYASKREPSSLRFREYVEQLPQLFIRVQPSLAVSPPPAKSTIESKSFTWEWPHTKVMLGMHVRRTGGNDRVVGALTAADTLAFTQQGVLFAGRAGIETGRFKFYTVGGVGGLQLVTYDLAGRETDMFGTTPRVMWSGLLTAGIGMEVQVHRSVSVGTEYDVAMLTASAGQAIMWPDPRMRLRSWFTGVKVVY